MAGISKRVSGSWVNGDYGIMKTATDTITTLPAVLYPNATTATVGLSGNMSQASGVSPATPIQPSECGERTNNLSILNGVTDIIANKYYKNNRLTDNPLTAGTYTLSFSMDDKTAGLLNGTIGYGTESSYTYDVTSYQTPDEQMPYRITVTFTLTQQYIDTYGGYIWIRFVRSPVQTDFRYTVSEIRLNIGSTALPYEPFGVKIPILSANTTTPVYLGEVETTRQIKKVVYDGTESWSLSKQGNNTRADTPQIPECLSLSPALCTHFDYNAANVGYPRVGEFVINSSKAIIFGVDGNTFADVNAWKSYLAAQYAAGTPVCVWYVLATPETAVVNEPIRKIGDYADTLSNISIPVTAGGDTISVGTTLQPSEVTVNYKGWHPVADVHERESGQWD